VPFALDVTIIEILESTNKEIENSGTCATKRDFTRLKILD
jgi:hypothetical protein